MNFEQTFPLRYYMNLGRREDRRSRIEASFEDMKLQVARFPAVDQRWVRNSRGYRTRGKYASGVTRRIILRRAIHLRAEAVFIFEDDVVLKSDFREFLERIELPEDWGIFYLGCQHTLPPIPVSCGLVRCVHAVDTHAFGVRRPYFRRILSVQAPRPEELPEASYSSDRRIAWLHDEVPAYAVFPNLAWQENGHSDLLGRSSAVYSGGGCQRSGAQILTGIPAENLGGRRYAGMGRYVSSGQVSELGVPLPRYEPPSDSLEAGEEEAKNHLAFLFMIGGNPVCTAVWYEYFSGHEKHASVYLHAGHGGEVQDSLFRPRVLPGERWTDADSLGALRGLLQMIRTALGDGAFSHFVLVPEGTVPIAPIQSFRRSLSLDSRSRIGFEDLEKLQKSNPKIADVTRACAVIPENCWRFQSSGLILNSDAANCLIEDDFSAHFEGMVRPLRWYVPTVLGLKGFPIDQKVINEQILWSRWDHRRRKLKVHGQVDGLLAGELDRSGKYFARSFNHTSNIGAFGLHRSKVEL